MSEEQEPAQSPLVGPPLNLTGAGPSLADEEKAMRGGRGGIVVGMIIFGGLLVGGLVFAMMSGESSVYREYGSTVNGLHTSKFNGFWVCALGATGAEYGQITSNTAMSEALHLRGTNGRKRYGDMVRERCIGQLQALERDLEQLIPPDEAFTANRAAMVEAVHNLISAWTEHRRYLNTLTEDPYSRDDAEETVTGVVRQWFEYRRAHREFNNLVGTQIGDSDES